MFIIGLPFLVAFAPIAYLWGQNAAEVSPASILMPTVVVQLLTALGFGAIWLVTRDLVRSAFSIAVAAASVLTFGHQVDGLEPLNWAEVDLLRWPVLVINVIVAGALITVVWRTRRDVRGVANYCAAATLIFVGLSVPNIVGGIGLQESVAVRNEVVPAVIDTAELPDIYYIVLDGYGRADVLSELYGHDNMPFLDSLEERGFYVADRALSNYAMTAPSLASSLNLRHLARETGTLRMIQEPEIVRRLQGVGYRYVHFATPWYATGEAPLADVRYSLEQTYSEFELVFLRTTMPGRFMPPPGLADLHLNTLNRLREVPRLEGPTFAFAHLILPHPPYVFANDGRVISRQTELTGSWEVEPYVEQLRFLNGQLTDIVDRLIADSEVPPIIILQADHGPAYALKDEAQSASTAYWERLAILNAYFVPPEVKSELYATISPVNTFRLLMRQVFGEDMRLLPDRSYFSWYAEDELPSDRRASPEFRDVTDIVRARGAAGR